MGLKCKHQQLYFDLAVAQNGTFVIDSPLGKPQDDT